MVLIRRIYVGTHAKIMPPFGPNYCISYRRILTYRYLLTMSYTALMNVKYFPGFQSTQHPISHSQRRTIRHLLWSLGVHWGWDCISDGYGKTSRGWRTLYEYCFMGLIRWSLLNLLWPSEAIWRQNLDQHLDHVMACCLTAPSHYLNQCVD